MTWLVLLNEAAGSRPMAAERVEAALGAAEVEHELRLPSSTTAMAGEVVAGAEAGRPVAVVGGDGTVNLAVDALMHCAWKEPPKLAVLPAGTGCDLLRTFALPQRIEEAAAHLNGPEFYRIEVGLLEGEWGRRHFVNVAQAGVGAAAAQSAPRLPRRTGRARYPLAFAGRLPGFPRSEIRLVVGDREHRGSALAVILANGQFFAGGWNVAPRASLNDGRFDVQIVAASKWEAPRLVPKMIKGLHLSDRAMRRVSGAAFELECEVAWPVECDGEALGNTPVHGAVLPGAIDLKI